jgi:hypothetical protein
MGIQGAILAVTAVTAAASISEQKKQGRAQERGQKKAQKQADNQAAIARRKQVRQARIQRADIIAQSANSGAAGSSSEAGALGSLQGQLGTQLGTSFQNQALSQGQSRNNIAAAKSQGNAAMFGAVSSLSGQFSDPKSIFKDTPGTP